MDESRSCLWLLLVFLATLFLLLLDQNQLSHAHSLYHIHHHGTPTNVTKNLYFPNFNSNPCTIQDIKLLGSAKVSSDGQIQIPDPSSPTVDPKHKAGRAIFASPIRLYEPLTKTPASFQTTFSFKFTTTDESGGNGLAFVIVPDEFHVGRPGPWLGILNDVCTRHKVFAVEFDTSFDSEFGDPNDDHVGINLGSIVSFKTENSSKANISLHDTNIIHRAWINYDSQRRWIKVHLGSDGEPKPSQPLLSLPLNLSPFLQEYMFVGFSASTGNSAQIHSVLSWNFSSTNQALIPKPSRRICRRNLAQQVSKHTRKDYTEPASSFMIFVSVMVLCTVALICFYFNSKRRDQNPGSILLLFDKKRRPTPPSKPRKYSSLEVFMATRRFSKLEIVGSDSRGVLYRGTLPNGCHVAVKRFSSQFLKSSPLDSTWVLKRIGELAQIIHPNFVSIRGWCCDNNEALIVYDYFQNGSLDRWLFGLGVLPWSRRFKLIKEIAKAVCFLHSKGLAHGNLKTSSVFLDPNYQAVLGDYGFIFFMGESASKVESVASKKRDVFEFGMLVLETIAGKKTVDFDGGDQVEMGLLGFAWSMHERGEKAKVVDERVGPRANMEQVVRVLEIGLSCTLSENNGRPCMEEVVQLLNTQKPIPKLPLSRPVELFRKHSARLGLSA